MWFKRGFNGGKEKDKGIQNCQIEGKKLLRVPEASILLFASSSIPLIISSVSWRTFRGNYKELMGKMSEVKK